MSQFTCCTCPEPPGYDPEVDAPLPKYRNKCGCPTATLECVSSQKNASLCGLWEYSGYESSPPKKYRNETWSGHVHAVTDIGGIGIYICGYQNRARIWSGSVQYDAADCSTTDDRNDYSAAETTQTSEGFPCANSGNPGTCSLPSTAGGNYYDNWTFNIISATLKQAQVYTGSRNHCETTAQKLLSDEDTEADALARATEIEGTSCSSIYELRTTSFLFTVRTVKFSLELTNLCRGRAYEGCVRIRKRKAFSGTVPEGEVVEWENVEPFTFGPITPSAANTTDGVTTTAEITDQDLVGGTEDAIGWEYIIESAHVWPVSVGCDCPTDFTPPE